MQEDALEVSFLPLNLFQPKLWVQVQAIPVPETATESGCYGNGAREAPGTHCSALLRGELFPLKSEMGVWRGGTPFF